MTDLGNIRYRPLLHLASLAGISGLLFGYDTGVVSGVLISIKDDLGHPLSVKQEEFLVSSALLAAFLASLGVGFLVDRWGSCTTIRIASLFFIWGALQQALASSYAIMSIGRFILGVAVGLAAMATPLYLAEIAPPALRGRFVGSIVLCVTAGQVLAYLVAAVCINYAHGWRLMVAFGAVPALVQLFFSASLIESPRFLASKDNVHQALLSLEWLYGEDAQDYLDEILADVGTSQESNALSLSRIRTILSDPALRRPIILACMLQFFQQASGFNVLMYYSGKLFERAHMSNPILYALSVSVTNALASAGALAFIDSVGRRSLLLYTLTAMVVEHVLLGLALARMDNLAEISFSDALVTLAATVSFCATYAMGLGNVPWVFQTEIFPSQIRATGNALATATNWATNLIVASLFLQIVSAIGVFFSFVLFAVLAAAALGFVFYNVPETTGVALSQVLIPEPGVPDQ